jgi:type I restriction enzyme M protein
MGSSLEVEAMDQRPARHRRCRAAVDGGLGVRAAHDRVDGLEEGASRRGPAHGVLFRGGQEAAIRQRVLDDDLLEAVIGLPANLFYSTSIPTCILVFRAPGTKVEGRQGGVLFIDASRRFAKAKNRNVLTSAHIADVVTAYRSRSGADGSPADADGGGLAARFVPAAEIAMNGYDLNIGRYIKQAAAVQ